MSESSTAAARRRSILMMLGCTVLGAASQILMKLGTKTLGSSISPLDMLLTPTLFFGYALYGIVAVVFVFALQHGELSILYPIIALTYVWVTGLSVVLFGDSLGPIRVAGLLTIILGVAILGRDGKR